MFVRHLTITLKLTPRPAESAPNSNKRAPNPRASPFQPDESALPPAGAGMEAEPEPSRLVGEKDVLAAIAAEFLGEGAPVCAGRVLMTTFRFQFEPLEREAARARRHLLGRAAAEVASFFLVPLGCVAAVRKKGAVVELQTKDLRQLSFRFGADEITKARLTLMRDWCW